MEYHVAVTIYDTWDIYVEKILLYLKGYEITFKNVQTIKDQEIQPKSYGSHCYIQKVMEALILLFLIN